MINPCKQGNGDSHVKKKKMVHKADDKIPTDEIVALLEFRCVIYKKARSSNNDHVYFMPAVLYPDHNVAKESNDLVLLASLHIPPILFHLLNTLLSVNFQPQQSSCPRNGSWMKPSSIGIKFGFMRSVKVGDCYMLSSALSPHTLSFVFYLKPLHSLSVVACFGSQLLKLHHSILTLKGSSGSSGFIALKLSS